MTYRGSKRSCKNMSGAATRPDFIMISNIYDDLSMLVEKYGMTRVVEHLGHIADEKISKEFAKRIWFLVSTKDKIEK